MPETAITNPLGAYGFNPSHNREYDNLKNADTVALAAGDVVFMTFSTTTGQWTVTKAATNTSTALKYGVALEAIGVGRVGRIALHGFAYVNVGSNTVAAGDAAQRDGTTAGTAGAVTPADATVAGTLMGTFLGAKGSSSPYPFANAAPVFLEKY